MRFLLCFLLHAAPQLRVARDPSTPLPRVSGSGPLSRRDGALIVVSVALIALGVGLRVYHVAEPPGLAWDEHHFVTNAQNYLHHKADWNDHPPLGKLFITQCIFWFGDNSLSWRLPSLVSGLLNVVLVGFLGTTLFKSWRAGLVSAAFLAGDGFFIAYSRTALLDGVLTTFMLATAAVAVRAKSVWHIALASVLLGLGCSVKFSVIVMLVPIVLVSLVMARAPRWSVLALVLAPISYYLVYARGLVLQHKPWTVSDVYDASRALYVHHAKLTDMTHPFVSYWYTWLVPSKPIPMRFSQVEGVVRTMTTMGNPLLWWAVSASVLWGAVELSGATFGSFVRFRQRSPRPLGPLQKLPRGEVWGLLLWFLPVLPWILSRRDSYIYHYLPAYGFGVVLAAGKLTRVLMREPRPGWIGIGAIALASFWCAPVWAEIPISRTGYELRMWFPGWRNKDPEAPARPRVRLH